NFETEAFVREPGEGHVVDVLGMTHIYKVTGAESGGHVSIWESGVPPGLGAPPHTHTREDEAVFGLSGGLEVAYDGGAPVAGGPGRAASSSAGADTSIRSEIQVRRRRACSSFRRGRISTRCSWDSRPRCAGFKDRRRSRRSSGLRPRTA